MDRSEITTRRDRKGKGKDRPSIYNQKSLRIKQEIRERSNAKKNVVIQRH